MTRPEINLEPIAPVRRKDWHEVPAPQEVHDNAGGFPVSCFYHPTTELTVISSIEQNPMTDELEHILQISRAGTRQASEREINFVLTNFRATSFEPRDRRGPVKVFAKRLETNGKPITVRMVH